MCFLFVCLTYVSTKENAFKLHNNSNTLQIDASDDSICNMNTFYEYEANDIYTRHVREEKADGSGYKMHIHDRCEIYYFIEGEADYLVEGSIYHMKRGSLLVMRPGEVHMAKLLKTGIYERYAINFPISIFDDIDPERRLMSLYSDHALGKQNLYEKPEFESLFEKICGEYTDEYERKISAYGILLEMISRLYEDFKDRSEGEKIIRYSSVSEKILRYVNRHICDDLSISILSKEFYLSRSQIGRLFKRSTGASPWEYITAKRLILAKEMLRKGISAKETAEKCGFGDYSSFYRAYFKMYRESPKNRV